MGCLDTELPDEPTQLRRGKPAKVAKEPAPQCLGYTTKGKLNSQCKKKTTKPSGFCSEQHQLKGAYNSIQAAVDPPAPSASGVGSAGVGASVMAGRKRNSVLKAGIRPSPLAAKEVPKRMVQVKGGPSKGYYTKPKAEHVDIMDLMPDASSILAAEKGELVLTRSEFLDQIEPLPGIYVWAIRAPGCQWTPIYCGMGDGRGDIPGLKGRMQVYFRSRLGIAGPVDSVDKSTDTYKYKTAQMVTAYSRNCDVKVFYKYVRDAAAAETALLTAFDFPCNSKQNSSMLGSYRHIDVCTKRILFLPGTQRTVPLNSKRERRKPIVFNDKNAIEE